MGAWRPGILAASVTVNINPCSSMQAALSEPESNYHASIHANHSCMHANAKQYLPQPSQEPVK